MIYCIIYVYFSIYFSSQDKTTADISDFNLNLSTGSLLLGYFSADADVFQLLWLFLRPTADSSDTSMNYIDEVDRRQFRL